MPTFLVKGMSWFASADHPIDLSASIVGTLIWMRYLELHQLQLHHNPSVTLNVNTDPFGLWSSTKFVFLLTVWFSWCGWNWHLNVLQWANDGSYWSRFLFSRWEYVAFLYIRASYRARSSLCSSINIPKSKSKAQFCSLFYTLTPTHWNVGECVFFNVRFRIKFQVGSVRWKQ